MIDSFLSIVDRIIRLNEYRGARLRRIHKELLEPLFLDLEKVHHDYEALLEDARALLPSRETALSLFNENAVDDSLLPALRDGSAPIFVPELDRLAQTYLLIQRRRVEFEPLRVKVRAASQALRSANVPKEAASFVEALLDYFPSGTRSPDDQWQADRRDASVTFGILSYMRRTLDDSNLRRLGDVPELMNNVVFFNRAGWQKVCIAYADLKTSVALEA